MSDSVMYFPLFTALRTASATFFQLNRMTCVVIAETYRVIILGTAADPVFIFQEFRKLVFAWGVLGNVLAYAEFSVRKAASVDNFIFKELLRIIAVRAYFLRNIRKNRNGI